MPTLTPETPATIDLPSTATAASIPDTDLPIAYGAEAAPAQDLPTTITPRAIPEVAKIGV